MALGSRLGGFVLCVFGGDLIGWAQGLQSLAVGINANIDQIAGSIPNLDSELWTYVENQFQQSINPNLGTYWALGIVLVFFGFVLIARGDGRRKNAKPAAAQA